MSTFLIRSTSLQSNSYLIVLTRLGGTPSRSNPHLKLLGIEPVTSWSVVTNADHQINEAVIRENNSCPHRYWNLGLLAFCALAFNINVFLRVFTLEISACLMNRVSSHIGGNHFTTCFSASFLLLEHKLISNV